MRKYKVVKIPETDYFVKVTNNDTGDNYGKFGSLYKKGSPHPLFGTCFKNDTQPRAIKEWAINKINSVQNNQNDFKS